MVVFCVQVPGYMAEKKPKKQIYLMFNSFLHMKVNFLSSL